MAPKVRNPNASAVIPKRSVTIRTSGNTTRPASTSPPRRSLSYNVERSKNKQNLSGKLIKKTQLSGKLIYPVGDRAYLQGGETLYLQPIDRRNIGTRKNPLPKKPSHAYPTRYQLKLKRKRPQKWKSSPKAGGCPLCRRTILPSHDRVWCQANSCTPVHRSCAEEYHGRLCLCMGLLCDWHPQGRRPNNQVYANRDNCVCCGGKWFPSRQEVMNKWCIVLSTEIFDEYVVRFFPQIPWEAYDLDYTRLEDNDDFPTQGRNPMNVMQEQQTLGATLTAAKDNTWIAYNANHHPIVPPGTVPDMYASITWDEYLDAIEAGFFESQLYGRHSYKRLLYSHDWPINAEPETQNLTISRWEWFNFDDSLNKWFHMPSTGMGSDLFRRLFEAAPPNGMILDL